MAAKLPTNATVEITGFKSYFDYVQEVSSNLFMPLVLLALGIIVFFNLKQSSTNGKAFLGTSFICMVLSIILTALGWLASMYMYMAIILTAIGAVWAYLENAIE